MAITAATKNSDFSGFLKPELSADFFADAAKKSVVQGLVKQTPLGINGEAIPLVTKRPTANWVEEAGQKPTTDAGLGLVNIVPKKLAAIAVVSAEVVRANPGNYMTILHDEISSAFATAFDLAALYGLGGDGTGKAPFEHHVSETTNTVALGTATQDKGGIHADFNAGLKQLAAKHKRLTGFALDSVVEPTLIGAVDTTGRPVYMPTATAPTPLDEYTTGMIIGRPALMNDHVAAPAGAEDAAGVVGFGGDWSKARWGVVGGINYRVSTEATVTLNGQLTSLFEHNLVAVLAEAEYGFAVADTDAFVEYTQAV